MALKFRGIHEVFYYPEQAGWIDLCQTIDEVFNPANWHHFVSDCTPLHPDDIVVDCGAAEGLFSFFAASRARKIYAVEPVPSWHPGLKKTFSQFSNVELLQAGVGHQDAMMRMTDETITSCISSKGTLEVPIRTLDSLFHEKGIKVSFIKADVEGFEFPMLLGGEQLIRQNRPKISMTVYHDTNHFIEVREYLTYLHNDYRFRTRGMAENGNPVLLQAY
jgi:FkbM family methyltransferase